MSQEIFIMLEQNGGVIEEPSFSLLSEGKRLSQKLGNSHVISAIVMGPEKENLASELGSHGADRVYCFADPFFEHYRPDLYTEVIINLVKERNPDFFLLGATSMGGDLALRISARLRAGLVTHCVDIQRDDDQLKVIKSVSDEYLYEKVIFRKPGLKMLTISPGAMTKAGPGCNKVAEVVGIFPKVDQRQERARFIETIKADPKTIGLEEADIIVCGGRGVGKEAFDMVYRLAEALNGSVGGTRPVIDWGILPDERQVGQTGAEIFPTLLVACGVSGANEFTVGMKGSKLVIAVNKDRKARIFKFADLGIIGDLHAILPLVIDEIEKNRGGASPEKGTD